ncbi:hypothetical protein AwErysi_02330 [Erysipelotrichaceae bacterium]|nr:hypothetical protein AwErysi_02330 [Erysipelotrichaceae bacterium]
MEEHEKNVTPKRRKKKKRLRKGRLALIIILLLVLVGGGIYLATRMLVKEQNTEIVEDQPELVDRYTTFQIAKNEEYQAVKNTYIGSEDEVKLVAEKFSYDLFTMWGVEHSFDFGGQEFIPAEQASTFEKNIANTLYFRFDETKMKYGVSNLPIITGVDADITDGGYVTHADGNVYDAYDVELILEYQNGEIEGTDYDDLAVANTFLQQWPSHVERASFFFVPDEEGGGQWFLSILNGMTTHEQNGIALDATPSEE